MSDQFVVFAIPAFDHSIILEGVQSLLQTQDLMHVEGIPTAYVMFGGDPYLPKVRNLCVSRALRLYPQMTDFFFIDSDISWPAEAVLRLLKRPEEVVCGVYPKKNDNLEFPTFLDLTAEREYVVKDGLFKANAVPTGFLRIKRAVLERMCGREGRYKDSTGGEAEVSNLFEALYRPFDDKNPLRGDFWGEDFDWSRKWLQMGGDMWVDPDIDFGHMGKKIWRGNLSRDGILPSIADGKATLPGTIAAEPTAEAPAEQVAA